MGVLERAADFIWCNARLLERALFAYEFQGGAAAQVQAVVRAYRNADGGFGQALEPDLRCPTSQPLFAQIALQALQTAGVRDAELAGGVCDFLAAVALPEGPVPIILPDALEYPHAAHWNGPREPDPEEPNPTAALVGLLLWQGVRHPWLERATAWCWSRMERPVAEAHSLSTMLVFLRHAPERDRAAALGTRVARQAFGAAYFQAQPGGPGYGLTPLQLVPAPDAPGRAAFSDEQIAAHLDHLLGQQEADGGWPVSWSPSGAGALQEWRGILTLEALRTLRAYGRI